MAKPVILTVDDDPQVLNAIERDLRHHFGVEYSIVKAESGRVALETTGQLKKRGRALALFLVDERMPEMTGTQFLVQAIELFPDAKRALLTAYADTEAAITAINRIGLDHYLLKPWEPPEQKLYPVLDDLLNDWHATTRPQFEGIRVAGLALSAAGFVVRDFLSANQVPYQWVDLNIDSATRTLVETIEPGLERLPVVLFPDGSSMVQPSARMLADKLGMQTKAQRPFYDLVVIGGGPAGLGAAVYASSEGLKTVLVERNAPGGQAGTSSSIENYLGFPGGVSGADLARRAATQARRFGTEILTTQDVVEIRRNDPYRTIVLGDGSELNCFTVLIASGMEVRQLDLPGLDSFMGAGVYYGAALTEANTYRGQDVVIVGGANSAGQGALFFARTARSVNIVLRGSSLQGSMSQYLIDRIEEAANITVTPNSKVVSIRGDGRLEAITIQNAGTHENTELPVAALFIFIGSSPRTQMVAGLVERDAQGFILTGADLMANGQRPGGWTANRDPYLYETSVPGIFAAGDSRHGSGKRVAAAVGEGSATVSMIHQYLHSV